MSVTAASTPLTALPELVLGLCRDHWYDEFVTLRTSPRRRQPQRLRRERSYKERCDTHNSTSAFELYVPGGKLEI